MSLEYDETSNTFHSHLGGELEHSFETLAAARRDLRLIGLRIAAKIDMCTWRVEFIEPVAERADPALLRCWAIRYRERIKRPDPAACRQNG
jgi:hypothetical protein